MHILLLIDTLLRGCSNSHPAANCACDQSINYFDLISNCLFVHVPNFGRLSGSEDRGGGDNSIQFINFGRVGDKSFKEWRQKWGGGGGRMGDNNILIFSSYCTR